MKERESERGRERTREMDREREERSTWHIPTEHAHQEKLLELDARKMSFSSDVNFDLQARERRREAEPADLVFRKLYVNATHSMMRRIGREALGQVSDSSMPWLAG